MLSRVQDQDGAHQRTAEHAEAPSSCPTRACGSLPPASQESDAMPVSVVVRTVVVMAGTPRRSTTELRIPIGNDSRAITVSAASPSTATEPAIRRRRR